MKNKRICFILHTPFIIFLEYKIRFGIVNSEILFPFVFALAFRYICMIKNVVTWILV